MAPLIVTITLLGLLSLPTLTLPKNSPESTLPFNQSLQILKSALSDSSFKSSGVLPFKINYDLFRPLEMNKTNDWNKSFEHSFNEIIDIIINLKVLGIAALGWLLLKLLKISLQEIDGQYEITRSISVSCLIGITLLFIYPGSTQLMITLLSLFALKIILLRPKYQLIFSPLTIYLSLIILLPVTVMAGYLLTNITLANYHYNQGLKNLNDLQSSYSSLETANKIYPYSDIYHSNLAIVSFALGTKLVQETPGLSPEAQQEITNLLQNSLKNAERAVELNPKSKDNWLVLASIYQRIGRSNPQASQLADAAYNQALAQNPTNPSLLFTIAESYFTFGKFSQAAGFFEQAITLKDDYANAYYNLSLTYKELGRVADASRSIDTALNLLDPTSIDYQAAKKFKAELVK